MHKVDFNFVSRSGETLFHNCLQPIVKARVRESLPKNQMLLLTINEILNQTKANFMFLINRAEFYDINISKILAQPNRMGDTAFRIAYDGINDESIIECLMKHNVEINFVNLNFRTVFPRPLHAESFIKKGLNLKIISTSGRSALNYLEDCNVRTSISFPSVLKKLIDILPNSIYFSPVEQKCMKKCPVKGFSSNKIFIESYNNMKPCKIFVSQK